MSLYWLIENARGSHGSDIDSSLKISLNSESVTFEVADPIPIERAVFHHTVHDGNLVYDVGQPPDRLSHLLENTSSHFDGLSSQNVVVSTDGQKLILRGGKDVGVLFAGIQK